MSRILSYMSLIAAVLVVVGATVTPSYADGAGEIKNRQLLMKAIGAHMGAMGNIMKGKGGNSSQLAMHAAGMANLAKMAQTAFPAGSGPDAGKTEALPKIWESGSGFAKVLAGFETNAAALAVAAKGGDMGAIGKAMGALGKGSCGACHKGYRMKKK